MMIEWPKTWEKKMVTQFTNIEGLWYKYPIIWEQKEVHMSLM